VQPPPGKCFTKGNPIKDTDFDEVRQLWDERPTTERSWTVPVADIVASSYDMTAKNPNQAADVSHLSPEELIASALSKEQQIVALMEEMQVLLREVVQEARRGRIAEWFPAELDESWPELAQIVEHIENGWSPRCLPEPARPGEWGVL